MATMYCALCDRPVDAKRRVGAGTIALAVLSGGVWLLAIPFYRRRCSICESTAVSATGPASHGNAHGTRLEDMEQRLSLAEAELEAAVVEIERLKTEQEFYRQLLGTPDSHGSRRVGGGDPAVRPGRE